MSDGVPSAQEGHYMAAENATPMYPLHHEDYIELKATEKKQIQGKFPVLLPFA